MLVSDLASRPARPARSRVLRLRGLPYRALEDDILHFLDPLCVTRVHICRRNGRATGEAYVQLESRHEAGEALRTKNRQHLGNRYIELFEAGESDIGHTDEAAVSVATASSDAAHPAVVAITAVRVAGLLHTSSAQDVADFLEGVNLRCGLDSVVLLGDQEVGTRDAIVELADETAQRLALSKNNQLFGNCRIQVFPLTASQTAIFAQASAQGISLQHIPDSQQQIGAKSHQRQQQSTVRLQQAPPSSFDTDGLTLKLRGLPYSASIANILEFFEGFQLTPDSVHLETRDDRQGNRTGTGVAYVQFASADDADLARHSKHKQMMGSRYIECMIFIPGLHFMARVTANIGGSQVLAPAPFLVQPHQDLSGTQPSGPMPPGLEPPGWSRPYSPRPPVSARSAFEGLSPSARFHTAPDQFHSSIPERPPLVGGTGPFRPLQPTQAMQQMGSATPTGVQGFRMPFSLQQQQQRLLLQQQYAMQQQQQQMIMQQQAMQQWRGQQWQGGVTPLGVAQGWLRPYPMGMVPRGPLQMASGGPVQGGGMGLGMAGEGMAYAYAPGPGYAWAPMHPANPSVMDAGVQAFPAGQQGAIGVPYPGQSTVDSRLAHSPHGGRTPGRGSFRTPFSHNPQSRLSRTQSATQNSSGSGLSSQGTVSARRPSDSLVPAGMMTDMEAMSLADDLGGRRLSPIVTNPALSPSDVILASAARSRNPEFPLAAHAQMSHPPGAGPLLNETQKSESAGLPVQPPTIRLGGMGKESAATTEAATANASADSE